MLLLFLIIVFIVNDWQKIPKGSNEPITLPPPSLATRFHNTVACKIQLIVKYFLKRNQVYNTKLILQY